MRKSAAVALIVHLCMALEIVGCCEPRSDRGVHSSRSQDACSLRPSHQPPSVPWYGICARQKPAADPTDRLEALIDGSDVDAGRRTRAPAPRAQARLAAIRAALERANVSAVVCTLPANVLLLSGYWPVIGTACAIVWRRGPVVLILPPDEQELASVSWADVVRPMTGDIGTEAALSEQLGTAAKQWGGERIAVEHGPWFEAASYAAMCIYGASLWDIAAAAWPMASLVPADPYLAALRAHCTDADQERIGAACKVAERAFLGAPRTIRPGIREVEVAARVRARLGIAPLIAGGRSDGYVYCMSGAAAAGAYRAYARSTSKRIDDGDLVLVHCNAYVDGYWTDVTRTYCVGDPDNRQAAIYDAIFAAREAALAAVRPGLLRGTSIGQRAPCWTSEDLPPHSSTRLGTASGSARSITTRGPKSPRPPTTCSSAAWCSTLSPRSISRATEARATAMSSRSRRSVPAC